MTEVIDIFNPHLPFLSLLIVRGFLVFLISLGIVYIFGRMLNLIKTPTNKNFLAIVCMLGFSYWSTIMYDVYLIKHPLEIYWRVVAYTAMGSVFYVLVGFDLYNRFNEWCDNKFSKKKK